MIYGQWRTGRKLGRTIYRQHGDEPSDYDSLVGLVETAELAKHIVAVHNRWLREQEGADAEPYDPR